jgi:hypothetical protein
MKMKKSKILLFLLFCLPIAVNAQNEIRASMGVSGISTSSLRSYINRNFASSDQQVAAFNTAISFAGEYGYQLKENFQIGVEYDFMLNSFDIPYYAGSYELSYNIHSPSVTAYYVYAGSGFKLKAGGGAGPRFITLQEKVPPVKAAADYSSTGFGVLIKAEGLTTLGGNIYAYIGGDLRVDFNGEPKKNGANLINAITNEKVNMNSVSAGLKLGVTYLF